MHVLITGGTGFIGAALSKKLLDLGKKVTIVDNFSNSSILNIDKRCKFYKIDVQKKNINKIFKNKITHVVHLLAQSSGEISFEDPINDLKINAEFTLKLLNISLKHKIKKFIFASSMNVYGDVPNLKINENYPTKPESFYGIHKLTSENYIKIFSELGLSSIILRLFNVYGPGQNLTNLKQGMISIYCSYILNKKKLIIKGSPERFRDFIYIDDVIDAILLSLNNKSIFNVINICTGKKTTVKELISKILLYFNYKTYPTKITNGTPRDQFGIYGSNNKAKKILKWTPKYDIDKGIKLTLKHYLENENKMPNM